MCVCVRARVCTFPHANCCAPDLVDKTCSLVFRHSHGCQVGWLAVPYLFIVKNVNQSSGFSGLEGKGYLLSTV